MEMNILNILIQEVALSREKNYKNKIKTQF
jgi:hypothetical protein